MPRCGCSNDASYELNWQIDKWLLARYAGSLAITVYTLGSQINTIFIKCSTAISEMFAAKVHVLIENNRDEELNSLFAKVGRVQIIVILYIYYGFIKYWDSLFVFLSFNKSKRQCMDQ